LAAKAVNKAVCDAGLEGKRRTNPVDAVTGKPLPRVRKYTLDRSKVVTATAVAASGTRRA